MYCFKSNFSPAYYNTFGSLYCFKSNSSPAYYNTFYHWLSHKIDFHKHFIVYCMCKQLTSRTRDSFFIDHNIKYCLTVWNSLFQNKQPN